MTVCHHAVVPSRNLAALVHETTGTRGLILALLAGRIRPEKMAVRKIAVMLGHELA